MYEKIKSLTPGKYVLRIESESGHNWLFVALIPDGVSTCYSDNLQPSNLIVLPECLNIIVRTEINIFTGLASIVIPYEYVKDVIDFQAFVKEK